MRNSTNRLFASSLILSLTLFASTLLKAQGLPDWGQFQGDAQHSGASPFAGLTTPALPLWTFPQRLDEASVSVAADGTVYFVGQDSQSLHALTPNGEELWSTFLGTANRGVPALSGDGRIYVGGEDGELYALDSNGNLQWVYSTPDSGVYGTAGILGTPALATDGTIYVQGMRGDMFAVTPEGTQIWNTNVFDHGGVQNWFWMTSATLDPTESHVYIQSSQTGLPAFSTGHLFSFNAATGALEWALPIGDGYFATPTVAADGTVYAGAQGTAGRLLYAINPDGSEKWRYAIGGQFSSVGLDPSGEFVYATGPVPGIGGSHLVKLNTATGAEVWRQQVMSHGFIMINAPVVGSDGTVYIATANGDQFNQNSVHAYAPDGTHLWQFKIDTVIWSTVAIGPNGTIYFGADQVYALVDRQLVNQVPEADIVAQATGVVGDLISFNGRGSSDPDGDPITYGWSLAQVPTGSQATLFGTTARSSSLQPDLAGDYVVALVVNDGDLDSLPAQATVSVITAQQCALDSVAQLRLGVTNALDSDFNKPRDRSTLLKKLEKAEQQILKPSPEKAAESLLDIRNTMDGCVFNGVPDTTKPEDLVVNCSLAVDLFNHVERARECVSRM